MLLFLFLRYKFLNCKENLHSYLPAAQLAASPSSHDDYYSNNSNASEAVAGVGTAYDEVDEETMDVTMLNTRSRRRRQHVERPCSCLMPLIRFWGVITAIGESIIRILI